MRVIRLSHGSGNGIDKACLMTASNMLIGRGEDGDTNSCVCPILRSFIIRTNDAIPEELLGELYGDLAWEILGTKTDDVMIVRQRAFAMADWAVREIAPIALRSRGYELSAMALGNLPEIRDANTAAYAAIAAAAAAYAAIAAAAAANAAYAADTAADTAAVWKMCPAIIRRVAAIGDRRPVECVIDADTLAERLCGARR